MVGKKSAGLDDRLDQIGRELISAFSLTSEEAHAAASSPWLWARLRARIAAERQRRESAEQWSILAMVLRRALPATATAALLALGLFIFVNTTAPRTSAQFNDQALFETNDVGVQHIVFAERRPLSADEILDTIMNEEREGTR